MKFPNKLTALETFYEYLKKVLFSSNCLKEKQVKEIFLRALKDYFDGNISLEYLTVVANQLYYELNRPDEIDLYFNSNLAEALSETTEIDWRHNKKTYKAQLKTLENFYKKNKNF